MSLWRSKRRQDVSRRFGEQADEALYALALLQSDGAVSQIRAEELRENLTTGRSVLKQLRQALETPETADSYEYTIARSLCNYYGDLPKYVLERLDRHIDSLDRAIETLEYQEELEDVSAVFEVIEEQATETTDRDIDQIDFNRASDP